MIFKRIHRNRPGKQVSLSIWTIKCFQNILLTAGFHTLGNHFNIQISAHLDDIAQDNTASLLIYQRFNQALIQLQRIKMNIIKTDRLL